MRYFFFALGLGTMGLVGCGGSVATGGSGGHGGASGPGTGAAMSTGSTMTSTGTTSTNTSTTSTGTMTTGTGTTTASTGTASTSSSSTGGNCGKCMPTFICCNGACINPNNDIQNCGMCGKTCVGAHPYCDKGTCGPPPCNGIACPAFDFCCGTMCCGAGKLCCDVPGPVVMNAPACTDPVNGTCPAGCTGCMCASPDTPIATPQGNRPIADLAAGDLVYSVEHDAVVAVPVLRTHRTPVHDHHVVRVTLASGAVLEISARHPTADGRFFGDLHAGDTLDHTAITAVELIPYAHPFTYDVLPASSTHTYFAGGALIGTTLTP